MEIRIQQVAQWWDNLFYFITLIFILVVPMWFFYIPFYFIIAQVAEHFDKKQVTRRWEK